MVNEPLLNMKRSEHLVKSSIELLLLELRTEVQKGFEVSKTNQKGI